MGVIGSGEERLLTIVRPSGMEIPSNRALDMSGSLRNHWLPTKG